MRQTLRSIRVGKIIQTSRLVTMTTLFSLPTFAQSKNSIVTKCMSAVDARDKPQAMSQAKVILGWENIFSNELKINGAACLTFAMDKKHIYDNATNKFVSGELVDNAVSVEEINELQELVKVTKNKKELLLEEYEERNKTLIAIGSLTACTEMYYKTPSDVMMNAVCIEAFKKNGHPETTDLRNELTDVIKKHNYLSIKLKSLE